MSCAGSISTHRSHAHAHKVRKERYSLYCFAVQTLTPVLLPPCWYHKWLLRCENRSSDPLNPSLNNQSFPWKETQTNGDKGKCHAQTHTHTTHTYARSRLRKLSNSSFHQGQYQIHRYVQNTRLILSFTGDLLDWRLSQHPRNAHNVCTYVHTYARVSLHLGQQCCNKYLEKHS